MEETIYQKKPTHPKVSQKKLLQTISKKKIKPQNKKIPERESKKKKQTLKMPRKKDETKKKLKKEGQIESMTKTLKHKNKKKTQQKAKIKDRKAPKEIEPMKTRLEDKNLTRNDKDHNGKRK
ncbi:hypothetical protein [Salegentibacter holothuriorum]|uniref:hypothetical protein n=1 Tax=Salegentibacter holothuriorum TaxID=241145 RepID=UPI0009A5EAE3|nr:hypothetical protein [Salegentibacter holothuriorum]